MLLGEEENSRVLQQLIKTKEYADMNDKKINFAKTKAMIFNPCTSIDFLHELVPDNHDIEVDKMRILGVMITFDMKWAANTHRMVTRANPKL